MAGNIDCMAGIVNFTVLGAGYFCTVINIIYSCSVVPFNFLEIVSFFMVLILRLISGEVETKFSLVLIFPDTVTKLLCWHFLQKLFPRPQELFLKSFLVDLSLLGQYSYMNGLIQMKTQGEPSVDLQINLPYSYLELFPVSSGCLSLPRFSALSTYLHLFT